jgi:hypothetical protein
VKKRSQVIMLTRAKEQHQDVACNARGKAFKGFGTAL